MPSPTLSRAHPPGGMFSGCFTPGWVPSRASCRVPPADFRYSHTQRAGCVGIRPRAGSLLARDPATGWHLPTCYVLAHVRRVRRTPYLSREPSDTTPVARAVCPSPPPYAGLPVLTGRGTSLGASPAGSWPGARHHSACSAFHGGTPSMRVALPPRPCGMIGPRPWFLLPWPAARGASPPVPQREYSMTRVMGGRANGPHSTACHRRRLSGRPRSPQRRCRR